MTPLLARDPQASHCQSSHEGNIIILYRELPFGRLAARRKWIFSTK
jgi:hypothetical protein